MQVFVLLGIFLIAKANSEEIFLSPGMFYTFSSPGYPNIEDSPFEIHLQFKAKAGHKIISYCDDYRLRIPSVNPCGDFSMTYSGGERPMQLCTNQRNVHYISSGPQMSVDVKANIGQMLDCVARSTEEIKPAEILLSPENKKFDMDSGDRTASYQYNYWHISSSTGSKLSLYCSVSLEQNEDCYDEVLTIDTGSEIIDYCGGKTVEHFSSDNSLRVKIILNKKGWSRYQCKVEVQEEGTRPNEIENPSVSVVKTNTTDILLKAGEVRMIKGPDESEMNTPAHMVINFETAPDSKIEIYCDDLWFASRENPCEFFELTLSGGANEQKICEQEKYIHYISQGPSLKFEMKYEFGPRIECAIRSNQEPSPTSDTTLDITDGVYMITKPHLPKIPFQDALWILRAVDGKKLSLQCSLGLHETVHCASDKMIVDTGSEVKLFCKREDIVVFSAGSIMKIRVQLDKYGDSRYECKVQAITGPNADQHLNQVSEVVDSSEYGVADGKFNTTCECGRRNQEAARVMNGTETKASEYPWVVTIGDKDEPQRCGGSIITHYHILTAAHCMTDHYARKKGEIYDTVIYVGKHNIFEEQEHGKTKGYEVAQTFIPDEWWSFEKHYDIAVLVTKEYITFSKYVAPVCMSSIDPKLINTEIKITGWGMTEKGEYSPVLMETKLFVLAGELCSVGKHIICTYSKYSATCQADSGSPLIHIDKETNRYFQVALVSYGTSPKCVGKSGNSNVTYHYEWIDKIIKETKPEAKMCEKAKP